MDSPINSLIPPQATLSASTNSVNSSSQRLDVPSCSNNEIENFMTLAMVQELLEKLEDKEYREQCEKDMDETLERLKKPFFVKIED